MKEYLLSVLDVLTKQGLRISVWTRFKLTGFEAMKDRNALLDAIHLAFSHPEYMPSNGVTHCNQFVNEVCTTYGFKELDGKMANEICSFLGTHAQWSEIPMQNCQDLANGGTLIIAGLVAYPHGHVVVVCPGKEKVSGRWGKVPSVANIGGDNWIGKGCNWAFSLKPRFWCWRPSL